MDINKLLTAGEWMEVAGVAGYAEFGPFRLKVTLIDPLEYMDLLREIRKEQDDVPTMEKVERLGVLIDRILGLVTDWDFKSGDEPVPCTAETRVRYLRRLLFQHVLLKDGASGQRLLLVILEFSSGTEGALKN